MRRALLAACSCVLFTGCAAVGPDYVRPDAPTAAAFRNPPPPPATRASLPAAAAEHWWTGFGDPALDATVDLALAQNLDLEVAAARLQRARAAAQSARAALFPAGQLQVDVAHARQSLAGTNAASAAFTGRDVDLFDAGLGASWEADLFGGLRRGREAARADLAAAELQQDAVRLAVAADTADAYLQLRGFQARLALAERRIADDVRVVDLVRLLFDSGHAPRLQLDQAQSVLAQAQASAPLLRAGVEAQLNRLAVLTGRTPEAERGTLAVFAPVPAPPAPPAGLTPADLLRRRPDVAAAERRVAAASARIGVAVSDYYPKINFQGLVGFQSLGLGNLVSGDALLGQIQGALRWRLFDFGRVDAELAAARGAYAEALAQWRSTVLTAAEDVENALVAGVERGRQLDRLQAASLALEHARDASQAGYEAGAISLLDVIDTERQLLTTQDAAADVNTQRARAAVALRRALGG